MHKGTDEDTANNTASRSLSSWWQRSQLARLAVLSLLSTCLLVPIGFISDLVGERELTRDQAQAEVTGTWGGPQRVAGPWLVVPYLRHSERRLEDGSVERRQTTHHLRILPESLLADGDVDTEVRSRGIYEVPLYRTTLTFEGEFAPPDLLRWNILAADVLWDRTQLVVSVSDARAIERGTTVQWGGERLAFEPGPGEYMQALSGIHVPLGGLAKGGGHFAFELSLRGSEQLRLSPFGATSEARLRADWPHPSFQGAFLPAQRELSASGFEASWRIPHLARSYPQQASSEGSDASGFEATFYGVDFISPVDTYRMAGRSVKYAGFFLLLTFVVVWVLAVLSGRRVHSVQYLLTGAGCCLFYLLQASLAEHLGFLVAHALASLSVVAMVGTYSAVTLGGFRRAGVVAGVLSSLYAYLYVMLTMEDYALVTGAVALFVALATVMFVTRRVQW